MSQINHKVFLVNQAGEDLALLSWQNLQYRRMINGVSSAYFEMQIQNPVFKEIGFDFFENAYSIRIERGNEIVFSGELDEITEPDTRQSANDALQIMDRIGFRASHKLDHLSRIIAKPDSGNEFYKRSFDNKTLGEIVTTLITEVAARPFSPVPNITLGTVEDPINEAGDVIKLTTDQALYAESVLNWIDMLAYIGDADYWLDEDEKFHFVKRRGMKRPEAVFRLYENETGNNLASLRILTTKREMYNKIICVGSGEGVEKLFAEKEDVSLQEKYFLKEKVLAARQLDTTATIGDYALSQLNKYKSPERVLAFTPDISHVPFQGFEIGDDVMVDVDWYIYNFKKYLRIEGLTTMVDENSVERHAYLMSTPKIER